MKHLPISGFTENTTISKMMKQLDESLTALDNSKFFSEIREDIFANNENNVLTLNEETKNRLNALGKNVGDTIPMLEFLEIINGIIDSPEVKTFTIDSMPQDGLDLSKIPMGATTSGKSDILSCCPSVIAAMADLESARPFGAAIRKLEAEEQPLVIGTGHWTGIDLEVSPYPRKSDASSPILSEDQKRLDAIIEAQTEALRNRIVEEHLKKVMAAPVKIVYYMYTKKCN